jgi:hypothetical protein
MQGHCDTEEVAQLEIVLAELRPLDGRSVNLGTVREFLLAHVRRHPGITNPQADPPARVDDPVWLICGSHLQKLNRRSS